MQTLPKSNSPIEGGGFARNGKYHPPSNTQRNSGGGSGGNDNPPAKRRTSRDSSMSTTRRNNRSRAADESNNNGAKPLKRSFTKGDELTKLMSSKLPPDLFSVAGSTTSANNDNSDIKRDVNANDRVKQQSPPPKHWKEASSSSSTSASAATWVAMTSAATVASTASTSESYTSSKLGAALLSISKRKANPNNRSFDNATFDTYSSNYSTANDSGTYDDSRTYDSQTYDSQTYDSGMSTLSIGSESYVSHASGSYASRATNWKTKRGVTTNDDGSGVRGDGKLYARRYAKIILGAVGLAAMRLFSEQQQSNVNGSDGQMNWEEWDPKLGTRMKRIEQVERVDQLRARKLPREEGSGSVAATEMMMPTPPISQVENQELGSQIEERVESDWEITLRSWRSPEEGDGEKDEWDPKWDPKPVSSTNISPFNNQDTTKEVVIPNNPTTSQSRPKGKNGALDALREKNRLEHLENWKD